MSLDGVIQAPGGPDEDRENGFDWGGWAFPQASEAASATIDAAHGKGSDLLPGRKTHDIFAGYWPHQSGPMADSLNGARKFVATHRPETLSWGPVEGLGEDIVSGIRAVTAAGGADLVTWGSSTLTPLLIGRGKRVFSDLVRPGELELIDSKATPTGVIPSTSKPAGAMRTGSY